MVLSRRGGNGTTGLLTPEITISYLHTKYHCIVLKSSYHFDFRDTVMQQVRIEAMNVNYVVREVRKQQSEFVRECSGHSLCVCSSPGPAVGHAGYILS